MTQDEKDYFKVLGARVAQLLKDQALTQVQLAEALGISQQMVASYEVGRRRIPVSMLQPLAQALSGKRGLTALLPRTGELVTIA
jgi:transcriptional regulator with XRE-family HTH domain